MGVLCVLLWKGVCFCLLQFQKKKTCDDRRPRAAHRHANGDFLPNKEMIFLCVLLSSDQTVLVEASYNGQRKKGLVRAERAFMFQHDAVDRLPKVTLSFTRANEDTHRTAVRVPLYRARDSELWDGVVQCHATTVDIDPSHDLKIFDLASTPECSPREPFAHLLKR